MGQYLALALLSIMFSLVLAACGGGGGGSPTSDTTTAPPPGQSATAWTKYVGAHYTNTPNSGLTRTWAGGGLRDPGGSYRPALSGGSYVDDGYAAFTSIALP